MEGYKIYKYQRDVLIQQRMSDGSRYNPVKDKNGEYFIFQKEYDHCGLGVKAEYVPPIIEMI